MHNRFTILDVRDRVHHAQSVTVLTGAGISADSGVPTFRGAEGLWKNFRPEELASPDAFARDPKLVWEWYNWRRELLATKHPNAAHEALALLGKTNCTNLAHESVGHAQHVRCVQKYFVSEPC